jgi:hypothetical protein
MRPSKRWLKTTNTWEDRHLVWDGTWVISSQKIHPFGVGHKVDLILAIG